jgi:hypothetical protein
MEETTNKGGRRKPQAVNRTSWDTGSDLLERTWLIASLSLFHLFPNDSRGSTGACGTISLLGFLDASRIRCWPPIRPQQEPKGKNDADIAKACVPPGL